jgi:hypothetical protein
MRPISRISISRFITSICIIIVMSTNSTTAQTVLNDLQSTEHQATYLIITPPQYITAVQPLATFRTTHNNFSVGIAITDSIYASFGAGTSPDTAIKRFVQYVLESWQKPAPEYILLAGTVNTVPSHKERGLYLPPEVLEDSICVDQWLIESESDSSSVVRPLAAIGRFPSWNIQQLQVMVNKTITYEELTDCTWAQRVISVADWYESEFSFWEEIAQQFNSYQYPLYTDTITAYVNPSYSYRTSREEFRNLWNRGAGMINFIGHSNYRQFSHDSFFTTIDVDSLSNGIKLPFITWLFSQRIEKSDTLPIAVNLLQSQDRGAVGALVCSGLTFASYYDQFIRNFIDRLKQNSHESAGKAMQWAKTILPGAEIRKFSLLGDPALKIKNSYTIADAGGSNNTIYECSLNQNYPNPFNPETNITFHLQKATQVQLRVYNLLGQEIATLINSVLSAGSHTVRFNAGALRLASGIYMYRMNAGGFVQNKKMLYIQ